MKFTQSMISFAIGDAIGVPVEFNSRETLKNNPIRDMEEYGTHYQPLGTWSDDTSMTLATILSIIEKNNIDYNDIMNNFVKWYKKAEFTATDKCFDIGITCSSALYNFNGNNAIECGLSDVRSNGNGSLMRMLPIAFYCYYKKLITEQIYELVKNISSLTHSHEISILGCYIYTKYIMFLLDGNDKFESYKMLKQVDYTRFSVETINIYNRILKKDIYKLKNKEIKSSGYVVDTLEAVLWVILNTNDFSSSILTAVNLGEDTDTIGAITGSISGLIYNFEDIPSKWIENLKKKDYLIDVSNRFEKIISMEEF